MQSSQPVVVGKTIDLHAVQHISEAGRRAELSASARERLATTRAQLESAIAAGQRIYGVNTGFGPLSETSIPDGALAELQRPYNSPRLEASSSASWRSRESSSAHKYSASPSSRPVRIITWVNCRGCF